MPTDPSNSVINYFKTKAQSVPQGVPPAEPGEIQEGVPPAIDLNIPPLEESEYLTNKSTIFDYINQEYIDQGGLNASAVLNVDNLNQKYQTDYTQSVLDKALDNLIKASGGTDKTIYSSLAYSGGSVADLKDYLKITLRKPSSNNERNELRREKARQSLLTILDSDAQKMLIESPTEEQEKGLLGKLVENAEEYIEGAVSDVAEYSSEFILDQERKITEGFIDLFDKIESPLDENTLSEIYGNDGVVEVYLPLPTEIIEVYAHAIEQANLGSIEQLKAGLDYFSSQMSIIGALAGGFGQGEKVKAFKQGAARATTNFITGINSNLNFISASSRKAYNPVQEQLYRTPLPRAFQWTVQLMPTTQEQARDTELIIQALKEHSSPINMGDILYDFPGFVEFEFYINNKLADFLPRSLYSDKEGQSKVPSFIRSLNIEYSSNNMYSHFVDNHPTNFAIIIDIIETQPLDRNIIINDQIALEKRIVSAVGYLDARNSFVNDPRNL